MAESKDRKRFDLEYKRKIVRLVEELGQSPNQGANEIGVTPPQKTIRNWVRKFGKGDFGAFPGKGNLHPVEIASKEHETVSDYLGKAQVRKIGKGDFGAFPGKGNLHPVDEELRQMKKQIKDFQEKNAIPKKLWPSSPGTGNMVPIHQRPPLRIIRSEECLVLEVSRSAFTDG